MRLLVLLSLLLSLPAFAQTSSAKTELARSHYQSASAYFEQGRFDDAVREFLESYELSGKSDLLYNIAQCYLRKADSARAIDYFNRYLAAKPNAPDRVPVGNTIRDLQAQVGAVRVEGVPDGSEVSIAGTRVGETPLGAIGATAGKVRVEARLPDGSVRSAEVDVAAGQEVGVPLPEPKEKERVVVKERVVEKVVERPAVRWWTYKPGWAVAGVGAALLVGVIPLELLARQQVSAAASAPSEHLYRNHNTNGTALHVSAIAAASAGVAALGVATALFVIHGGKKGESNQPARVSLVPSGMPAGAGFAAVGSF